MSYAQTIVRRPVAILVLFLGIVGLGIFSFSRLSVDLFPEVDPPILVVRSSYEAGPEEVEEYVTVPLETVLANVSGIDTMSSTSAEGQSTIILEFFWDTDLTEATNEVRDQLELVADILPDEASTPQIFKFDPSSSPIMTIAVTGDDDIDRLREIAEEEIASELEKIDGVGQATTYGGRERIIDVALRQSALEGYGLSVGSIASTLSLQNANITGGELPYGEQELLVRSIGEFESIDEVGSTIVGYISDGTALSAVGPRPVRLDEVADVSFARADPESLVFVDGLPAVTISVQKESGTNTVEIAELVSEAVTAIKPTLPEGIAVEIVEDGSTAVKSVLDEVTSSLLIGAALGMAVLFIFLRNIRAAIIIGVSIPVSVVATFLAMDFAGLTLNMLSMTGLVIAIGMIVDSSIVVLEHIFSLHDGGETLRDAAIRGTSEMISPIVASALTTVSVFLPLVIFETDLGILGIIFNDIAFVVIFAILSSLAVAAALVPVLASRWIPIRHASQRAGGINATVERWFKRLETGYARVVSLTLRYRMLTLSIVAALLVVSVSFIPSLGFIFSPPTAEDVVTARVIFRQGTTLESVEKRVVPVAQELRSRVPEIETIVTTVGGGQSNRSNTATMTIALPDIGERSIDADAVIAELRRLLEEVPGAEVEFGSNRGQALTGSDPIDITLQSDDLDAAIAVADEIVAILEEQFPQITEPTKSTDESAPELQVVIDRARAADLGVSIGAVSSEVRDAVEGVTATRYERNGKEYDVLVRLRPEDRSTTPDLERIFVANSRGERVSVANVASLEYAVGPVSIERQDERRTVHVTGGLASGVRVSDVQPLVRSAIDAGLVLPDSVSLEYSGEQSAIVESALELGSVMLVAVLLVFAIMAGQFESFRMPFIIFFTIPLLIVGVIFLYLAVGQPISVFSLAGIVVLIGVVVNNGIVLVDYTNLLRRRGTPVHEAIIEAARTRLRPILMTTLTTILGLVPLAFFPGEGSQLTQPVGLTGVGGLLSSSVLTLFVVPVLYSLIGSREVLDERTDTDRRRRRRHRQRRSALSGT